LFDYEGAITSEPMDYFNFVTRADAKTVFYRFNPKYLEGAQADLDQAEVLSPNRQQTRFVVAKVLLLKGKTNEAFEEMRKAVELDPLSGDPHFYFGLLAFQVGDLETGFREIDSAKELGREPRNAREYRQLGNTYGDAERYERAREYYQAAIGLEPDDLDTRMKLGIVAYYTGENELAKEQFEYVLPKVPLFKNSANYQELKPIFDQLGVKE